MYMHTPSAYASLRVDVAGGARGVYVVGVALGLVQVLVADRRHRAFDLRR